MIVLFGLYAEYTFCCCCQANIQDNQQSIIDQGLCDKSVMLKTDFSSHITLFFNPAVTVINSGWVRLSVRLSVRQSVLSFVHQSVFPFVCPSHHSFVRPSVCSSILQFGRLSVHLSVRSSVRSFQYTTKTNRHRGSLFLEMQNLFFNNI